MYFKDEIKKQEHCWQLILCVCMCGVALKYKQETSLVVQWLRSQAPNAGGMGSILGQGTTSNMLQLKQKTKKNLPHAATKAASWSSEDPRSCHTSDTEQQNK